MKLLLGHEKQFSDTRSNCIFSWSCGAPGAGCTWRAGAGRCAAPAAPPPPPSPAARPPPQKNPPAAGNRLPPRWMGLCCKGLRAPCEGAALGPPRHPLVRPRRPAPSPYPGVPRARRACSVQTGRVSASGGFPTPPPRLPLPHRLPPPYVSGCEFGIWRKSAPSRAAESLFRGKAPAVHTASARAGAGRRTLRMPRVSILRMRSRTRSLPAPAAARARAGLPSRRGRVARLRGHAALRTVTEPASPLGRSVN